MALWYIFNFDKLSSTGRFLANRKKLASPQALRTFRPLWANPKILGSTFFVVMFSKSARKYSQSVFMQEFAYIDSHCYCSLHPAIFLLIVIVDRLLNSLNELYITLVTSCYRPSKSIRYFLSSQFTMSEYNLSPEIYNGSFNGYATPNTVKIFLA